MAGCFKSLIFLDCILIVLCFLHLGVDAGRCPRSVEKEARRCMRKMGAYRPQETLLNMLLPENDGPKQLCRNGKIQLAFSCLNKLYSSCAKSKRGMKRLKMLVDVDQWRNAIDYMCISMPRMDNMAECEPKAKREYEPCAYTAKVDFQRQLTALNAEFSAMTLTEHDRIEANKARVDVVCQFTKDIMICLTDPFEKFCSSEVAVIIGKTFQAFIPPACEKIAMQRSVKYTVDTQKPDMGRSQQGGGYPHLVGVVRQGDGNDDNGNDDDDNDRNDNNHHRHGGKSKSGDDPGSRKKTSFDGVAVVKGGNRNGGKGGKQSGDGDDNNNNDNVVAGNVAEVRGKDNGGGGGGGNGSGDGKDGGGGGAVVAAGFGSLTMSLIVGLVMMRMMMRV